MASKKGYVLQESTDFAFESRGKQYKLTINLEDGLLILKEGKGLVPNFIHIIGEPCKVSEQVAREVTREPVEESSDTKAIETTSEPKKSSKKGKK